MKWLSDKEDSMVIARIWIGRRVRYYITKSAEKYTACIGKPSDASVMSAAFPSLPEALDAIDRWVYSAYGIDGIERYRLEAVY